MADWSIEAIGGEFHDEPTRIPSGDCEAWERGESCGHTDCEQCGREAAAKLRAGATTSTGGLLALAAEVARIVEAYGARIPDGAVTIGDLARCSPLWTAGDMALAIDWAEGVIDAQSGAQAVPGLYHSGPSRDAYLAGRKAVEQNESPHDRQWLADARARRAQSSDHAQRQIAAVHRARYEVATELPPVVLPSEFRPLRPGEKAERLGITSAAGAASAPNGTAMASAGAAPGFESRAQHRATTLQAPVGETQRAEETEVRARQR